jgi:hypothetical protein
MFDIGNVATQTNPPGGIAALLATPATKTPCNHGVVALPATTLTPTTSVLLITGCDIPAGSWLVDAIGQNTETWETARDIPSETIVEWNTPTSGGTFTLTIVTSSGAQQLTTSLDASATFATSEQVEVVSGVAQRTITARGSMASNMNALPPNVNVTQSVAPATSSINTSPYTVTLSTALANQTLAPGTTGAWLGSYDVKTTCQAGQTLGFVAILVNAQTIANLRVMINNASFGTTQAVVTTNVIYGIPGTLATPACSTFEVDVYGDIVAGSNGTFIPATVLTSIGAWNATVKEVVLTPVGIFGQTLTISPSAGTSPKLYAAGDFSGSKTIPMGTTGATLLEFYLSNPVTKDLLVSSLTFTDNTTSLKAAFNGLTLNQNTVILATAGVAQPAVGGGFQYSIPLATAIRIPAGEAVTFRLLGNVATIASGGAENGSVHSFRLTAAQAVDTTNATAILDASRLYTGSITIVSPSQ